MTSFCLFSCTHFSTDQNNKSSFYFFSKHQTNEPTPRVNAGLEVSSYRHSCMLIQTHEHEYSIYHAFTVRRHGVKLLDGRYG